MTDEEVNIILTEIVASLKDFTEICSDLNEKIELTNERVDTFIKFYNEHTHAQGYEDTSVPKQEVRIVDQ